MRQIEGLLSVKFSIAGVIIMENTYSKFWDADEFILVSDGTKPAMEWAVEELRKKEPADAMKGLFEKGVVNTWVHWKTDTPAVRELCADHQCYTGRCPMLYLGKDLSMHGVHRMVAKLIGQY
jgi:hypothetical protein